jgi:hypothetical protein
MFNFDMVEAKFCLITRLNDGLGPTRVEIKGI